MDKPPTDKQWVEFAHLPEDDPRRKLYAFCSGRQKDDSRFEEAARNAPRMSKKKALATLRSLRSVASWITRHFNALRKDNPRKQLARRHIMF